MQDQVLMISRNATCLFVAVLSAHAGASALPRNDGTGTRATSWHLAEKPRISCGDRSGKNGRCSFHIEKNILSLVRIRESLYKVELQKTYLVRYNDGLSPAYCVFGGLARREGSIFFVFKNEEEDGSVVSNLRIKMSGRKFIVVDDDPASNGRYCGFHDSLGGTEFTDR